MCVFKQLPNSVTHKLGAFSVSAGVGARVQCVCLCQPVKGKTSYLRFDVSQRSRLRLGMKFIVPLLEFSPF